MNMQSAHPCCALLFHMFIVYILFSVKVNALAKSFGAQPSFAHVMRWLKDVIV